MFMDNSSMISSNLYKASLAGQLPYKFWKKTNWVFYPVIQKFVSVLYHSSLVNFWWKKILPGFTKFLVRFLINQYFIHLESSTTTFWIYYLIHPTKYKLFKHLHSNFSVYYKVFKANICCLYKDISSSNSVSQNVFFFYISKDFR